MDLPGITEAPGLNYQGELGNSTSGRRRGEPMDTGGAETAGLGRSSRIDPASAGIRWRTPLARKTARAPIFCSEIGSGSGTVDNDQMCNN